jgi:hypothetical protein
VIESPDRIQAQILYFATFPKSGASLLKLYKSTQQRILQQIMTHPGSAVFIDKVPKVPILRIAMLATAS